MFLLYLDQMVDSWPWAPWHGPPGANIRVRTKTNKQTNKYIDRHKARSARKHKYPLFSLTGEEEKTHKLTTYIVNPIQYHLETLSVFGC
jgi:hypothetical protein